MENLKIHENEHAQQLQLDAQQLQSHTPLWEAIEKKWHVTIATQGVDHFVEPHMVGVKNSTVQVLAWYPEDPHDGCGWMEFNFSEITRIMTIEEILPDHTRRPLQYHTPRPVPNLSDWEHVFTTAWVL